MDKVELEILFLEYLKCLMRATGYIPNPAEIRQVREMYYEMALEL